MSLSFIRKHFYHCWMSSATGYIFWNDPISHLGSTDLMFLILLLVPFSWSLLGFFISTLIPNISVRDVWVSIAVSLSVGFFGLILTPVETLWKAVHLLAFSHFYYILYSKTVFFSYSRCWLLSYNIVTTFSAAPGDKRVSLWREIGSLYGDCTMPQVILIH